MQRPPAAVVYGAAIWRLLETMRFNRETLGSETICKQGEQFHPGRTYVLLSIIVATTGGAVWFAVREAWGAMVGALLAGGFAHLALCALLMRSELGSDRRFAQTLLWLGAFMRIALCPVLIFPTNDLARYAWDGRLIAQGENPYLNAPNSARYAEALRQPFFQRLEHRTVPTVYPPLSQATFGLCWKLRPYSFYSFKIGFVCLDLAALFTLVVALRRWRRPPGWIALYALSPLILFEIAGAGHQDGIAALWLTVLLAWLAPNCKRPHLAGIAWILSVLAKGYTVVLGLILLRRLGGRGALATALTAAALCLPFLYESRSLFDGLSVYSQGWVGYGSVYRLVQWLSGVPKPSAPSPLADAVCLAGAAVSVLALSFRSMPNDEAWLRRALALLGVTALFAKIYFPWYFVILLPLLTLSPSVPWLLFGATLPILYLRHLVWKDLPDVPLLFALYAPLYAGLLWEGRRDQRTTLPVSPAPDAAPPTAGRE